MIPDSLAALVPGGRRGIVSLCYDDALPCQHEDVAPLLERHGLRATFYPHLQTRLLEEVEAWRQVAAAGHELGNHTVFHPCYAPEWLAAKRETVWTAPVRTVAETLRQLG